MDKLHQVLPLPIKVFIDRPISKEMFGKLVRATSLHVPIPHVTAAEEHRYCREVVAILLPHFITFNALLEAVVANMEQVRKEHT